MSIARDVLSTLGWTCLAILLFYGGLRLFDLLDPIDYQLEIRQGNVAAGLLLSSVVVSLAAIILAVILT